MTTELDQVQFQPLIKLTQRNVGLLTSFWTSPEVMSQFASSGTQWAQQANESAMKMMNSRAFAALSQGLVRNTVEFMSEFGQNAMATMWQRQLMLAEQAQDSVSGIVDEAQRTRRKAA
jgi:hypothetical protein